jgi:deazaflavin-dependent oxidoreductase (nitroreductase family)
MDPQDYSARTDYRPPAAWYRRLNHIGVLLTWLGFAPRDAVTLEVRGRASGKPRRTPILRTSFEGSDYLVALAGQAQWVRNVRATSGVAILRRRGTHHVHLEEVPAERRAPVIAEYLRQGRERSGEAAAAKQARYYFGLAPNATLEDITAIAPYYPVFRIDYRTDAGVEAGTAVDQLPSPSQPAESSSVAALGELADGVLLVDRFLPCYDLAVVHAQVLRASPADCYRTVTELDLFRAPLIRTLLDIRGLPQRLASARKGPTGKRTGPKTSRATFRLKDLVGLGWTQLGEIPGSQLVLGQVSQPWTPAATSAGPPVTPSQFKTFDRPGFAKIATSLRVDPYGSGSAIVTVETRVAITDDQSRRRFRRYWLLIGPFSAVIRRMAMRLLAVELRRQSLGRPSAPDAAS